MLNQLQRGEKEQTVSDDFSLTVPKEIMYLRACLTTCFITGDFAFGHSLMHIWSQILEICQIFLRILDQMCIKPVLKIRIPVIKQVIKHVLRGGIGLVSLSDFCVTVRYRW
jgi:hypothetical protein